MDAFRKMSRWISITLLSAMLSNIALADTVTFFHNDISGSPMAATDSAGNLLWKENYKPYGDKLNRSASSSENKIGFHGKPYDDNTGLSYMGARYYDPVLGRFMGIDPIDYQTDNLHSFNRYTFANNNPYKYVDPDGQFAVLAVPAYYLLTALAAALTIKVVMDSGRNSSNGNVSIGPLSYPGADFGNQNQWSSGRVYNQADTKSEGAKPEQRPTKTPNEGEPGSRHVNPGSGQERWYGPDRKPIKDIDYDHDHGQGVPHVHEWGRDANGKPERAPGRPLDPKIDTWKPRGN